MTKDLNLLRLILILNETRQTTTAAKAMNVSQPTISVMLKKLRQQFNDELFVRDKNTLEPTAKCQQLLSELPQLLANLEELYVDQEAWSIDKLQGEIKLLLPPALMEVVAAPLIAKILSLNPQLTIECSTWGKDAVQTLERNKASWGVSYLPMETNKNIVQRPLGYDKFVLIMRQDHPLQSTELEQVLSYPIGINIIPGYIEPSKAEMLIKKYQLDKHISLRSSDMGMMLALLKNSDFICVTSEKYAQQLPLDYRYEVLPTALIKDTFRRQFALFTHQRNHYAPFTKWLYEEILALSL